jgi:hypothetical protein
MGTAIETQVGIGHKKSHGKDFILVTHPEQIDGSNPLVELAGNSQKDELSEMAFTRLKEKGIWNAIISAAESINPKLKPAVDYGYVFKWRQMVSVAVVRWAHEISSGDNKIRSKAIRVILPANCFKPTIYYSSERETDGNAKHVWTELILKGREFKELPLERKIKLAMLNVSAKIEDNRSIRDGQFVGRPGLGNIL